LINPANKNFLESEMEKNLLKKKYMTQAPSFESNENTKYDPLSWKEYFDESEDVKISEDVFIFLFLFFRHLESINLKK
jgi:hypothetical protein